MHFYLSVNVFSTKVLIGDTIFTSPNGDGTAILRGHPSHAKVSPLAEQRKYLHQNRHSTEKFMDNLFDAKIVWNWRLQIIPSRVL